MRINARLDEASANQLEFLSIRLKLSTSDVVRQALLALYEQHKPKTTPGKGPFKHFAKHIGAYNLGDAQMSVNYKAEIAKYLDAKYPQHATSRKTETQAAEVASEFQATAQNAAATTKAPSAKRKRVAKQAVAA